MTSATLPEPSYGDLADQQDVLRWRLGATLIWIACLLMTLYGGWKLVTDWSDANARANRYRLLLVAEQQRQAAYRSTKPDASLLEVAQQVKGVDDQMDNLRKDRDGISGRRTLHLFTVGVFGSLTIVLGLGRFGIRQYHRYRVALQELIAGRIELRDKAEAEAKQKTQTLESIAKKVDAEAEVLQQVLSLLKARPERPGSQNP